MIEAEFARKFIEQITQYTEYNINIMNENGIIIAGRDTLGLNVLESAGNRFFMEAFYWYLLRRE